MHTNGISYDALSTAQRNGLVNPDSGKTIYNKDNGQLEINLGSPSVPDWQPVVPVSPDTNTWNMPGVAFVATDGNNFTGVVGDGNKPYRDINSAMDNAYIVIVKPGTYGQNMNFTSTRDNRHVICMEGVTFNGGGVYVYSGTTNVKFTGRAVMDGNFYNGLQVLTSDPVNIEFECKAMKRCRTVCWTPNIYPQCKISFTADYVSCTGVNGGGYAVRVYGTTEATFNIKEYAECSYAMWHCRGGFSGKLIVNCPETRTIGPLAGNPYGNVVKNGLWLDGIGAAEITINGDMLDLYTTDRNGGVVNGANLLNAADAKITVTGAIKAGNTQPVYLWYRATQGLFDFQGDIINTHALGTTESVPIWTQLTGWGSAADQTIIVRGNIQANHRIVVGTGKTFYIYSKFVYNADVPAVGGLFFKTNTGGNQQSKIYIYDSNMELGNAPGTSEIILGDASLATDIIGAVDVKGTEPSLSTVAADIWNYAQMVGLITPKV